MKYKAGDEVVLSDRLMIHVIGSKRVVISRFNYDGDKYETKGGNATWHFNDDQIDHEKTAELHKKDKALNHYQGELEKIVEQRNNDEYTKVLMKYGRVEGDGLDELRKNRVFPIVQSDKYARHKEITDYMHNTYVSKNKDYGDSFEQTHEKYGAVAGLTRIADKFHRLENIVLNDSTIQVEDESVIGTVIDLANYAVMFAMELEEDGD